MLRFELKSTGSQVSNVLTNQAEINVSGFFRSVDTGEIASAGNSVNHPSHYNSHPSGIECIQVVEWMGFNLGNAVKYIWRADHKSESPIEDLEKAVWYLQREIERVKGQKSKK